MMKYLSIIFSKITVRSLKLSLKVTYKVAQFETAQLKDFTFKYYFEPSGISNEAPFERQ